MARREQPLDLDEQAPRRARPAPPAGSPAGLFALAKWLVLGVGLVMAVVGFFQGNILQVCALAGLACFLGIVARILQAEEHRVVKSLACCVLLLTGVPAMAKAQKADPPKKTPAKDEAPPPAPFTDWVKFEHMDGKGGVEATLPKVAAVKKGQKWVLRSTDGKFNTIHPGDRFTLRDGTVMIVDKPADPNNGKFYLDAHKAP